MKLQLVHPQSNPAHTCAADTRRPAFTACGRRWERESFADPDISPEIDSLTCPDCLRILRKKIQPGKK